MRCWRIGEMRRAGCFSRRKCWLALTAPGDFAGIAGAVSDRLSWRQLVVCIWRPWPAGRWRVVEVWNFCHCLEDDVSFVHAGETTRKQGSLDKQCARSTTSLLCASHDLAGPNIGQQSQLFPEPKRCERGRCQCRVGRGECQSGEQTTVVFHVIGEIHWQ